MNASATQDARCVCGSCPVEWLDRGRRCLQPCGPCPICFEPASQPACYAEVANHSWHNEDRCDAHGICWNCLQQYVEMKIVGEGVWHLRCPGEACQYRLLGEDVSLALIGSAQEEIARRKYEQLRSESGDRRLKEVLIAACSDSAQAWILNEVQACPRCFVLARREDGCPHLVCRCGCDFCFRCGAPYDLGPEERIGCFCDEDDADSDNEYSDGPRLAAWLLRTDVQGLFGQTFDKLRRTYAQGQERRRQRDAERRREEEERARALEEFEAEEQRRQAYAAFGTWLWLGGADVSPPPSSPEDALESYAYLAARWDVEDSDWDRQLPFEHDILDASCMDAAFNSAKAARRDRHGGNRKAAAVKEEEAERLQKSRILRRSQRRRDNARRSMAPQRQIAARLQEE